MGNMARKVKKEDPVRRALVKEWLALARKENSLAGNGTKTEMEELDRELNRLRDAINNLP